MNKIGLIGCIVLSNSLWAAEMAETQVPGYYRQPLGEFQITALYDGAVHLPQKVFQGKEAEEIQQILIEHFVDTDSGVQTSVNAYLLNTSDHLLLIDSGGAKCYGETLGSIEENLHAAGYQNEQIDGILLTHLHPDHACGISATAGEKSFPNATVYVYQPEADFWLDKANLAALPEEKQALFAGAFDAIAQAVQPYQASKQFKTYALDEEIIPGVRALETAGHTIGHISYLVESDPGQLLILGDVVHNNHLQFQHPEISFVYDYNADQAVATRKAQFAQAAEQGYLVAGAHLPFPGIGHIRQSAEGEYEWLPIQYTTISSIK